MAYIMDTNEEERAKGKTVEVCTGCTSSMSRTSPGQRRCLWPAAVQAHAEYTSDAM